MCEHSHSCSRGPRVKGIIPAEKETILSCSLYALLLRQSFWAYITAFWLTLCQLV